MRTALINFLLIQVGIFASITFLNETNSQIHSFATTTYVWEACSIGAFTQSVLIGDT